MTWTSHANERLRRQLRQALDNGEIGVAYRYGHSIPNTRTGACAARHERSTGSRKVRH